MQKNPRPQQSGDDMARQQPRGSGSVVWWDTF